jgi:hypothetical protein
MVTETGQSCFPCSLNAGTPKTLSLQTRLEMTSARQIILAKVVAVCALLLTSMAPARAQFTFGDPLSKGQVIGILVGLGVGGAAIGVGVYYAVHHGHSLNGCAVSSSSGLELQNRGDQQTYALIGEVSAIKPGDRIRVSGKKEKKNSGAQPQFLVEKLNKDYGSCTAAPASL